MMMMNDDDDDDDYDDYKDNENNITIIKSFRRLEKSRK